MARLLEIDYEKIFSPKTMASLKGKSGQSLRQMLGDKGLMQTLMRTKGLLDEIVDAEDGYRDELEMVASQMVTDAYPIIDYANIKIDAKIVGMEDIKLPQPSPDEDPALPDFGGDDPEKLKAKRRIINGITQGASIRGAFGFLLFKEYLDAINPELVDKYSEILKLAFGIYDDENAIAMLLAMIAQNMNMPGGESEMEYDEENEQFVIKARAICFPMLVHEIVKGLYEIVGTEGFGADKEKNQAIVGAVDKLSNEPRDLQYGKFIYDAISAVYNQSQIDDPRVRELFFASLYKLPDDEFFPFIENAINDELTPAQKNWASGEMRDIARDLSKDDTGLADLDEAKPMQEITMKQAMAAAAVLLGTAGAPNMAKAQTGIKPVDKVVNLFKKKTDQPVKTSIAAKPEDTKSRDFDKVRAEWSAINKDTTNMRGFGEAVGQTESAARMVANFNAKAAVLKKMGKKQATFGGRIVDEGVWQLPNGNYHAMVVYEPEQP